ncbi:hypothetical protein THAOC_36507 [Thalassiosira oceanica]|uniref:Uncharacterized protein n=1 Tax=Thalassiosira oceanica TaxID=159749 RepID=K0REE5_THAOC|nr:hypothetical protein THAOC_36507 [Thalassiosira oceanica]|eukprot:EJK44917.1 hypothetical protein THAOC_36507 [Thalassiosira oceanica]
MLALVAEGQKSAEEPLPPVAWGLGEARGKRLKADVPRPRRQSLWDEAMAVADPLGRGIQSDSSPGGGGGGRGLIDDR